MKPQNLQTSKREALPLPLLGSLTLIAVLYLRHCFFVDNLRA